jgi:predicted dehydrogenase
MKNRIGLVGLGVGSAFFEVVRGIPDVEVAAVCDTDAERLDRVKAEQGIERTFTDFEQLLGGDVELVVISTPIQVHGQHALAAMEAGKHVLCQYIAAMDPDEAEALIRAKRASGVRYMFIETDCYERKNLVMMELAKRGILGELTMGRGHYIHDCKTMGRKPDGSLTWRGELWMESPGGRVSAVHNAMPLLEAFGERVAEVGVSEARPGDHGGKTPVGAHHRDGGRRVFVASGGHRVLSSGNAWMFRV